MKVSGKNILRRGRTSVKTLERTTLGGKEPSVAGALCVKWKVEEVTLGKVSVL